MKYLHKALFGLLLCAGLTVSCNDDDAGGPQGLSTDLEEIAIGPEGGVEKISVLTNIGWVAGVSRPWIAVSPANGVGTTECRLAIDSTLENTARTAQVRFSSESGDQKLVTVTQFGFGKQILLEKETIEVENSARYDDREFDVVFSTNVNCKIGRIDYAFDAELTSEEEAQYGSEREGWLDTKKTVLDVTLDRKARPRTVKTKIRWEMNTAPFTRIARIHLVPKNPDEDQLVDKDGNLVEDVVLTITQKPALRIEDNRAGDSLAIITINEKVQSMIAFETSENMQNWSYLKLWEATDKDLPCPEAVGRVRSVTFLMIDMKEGETLPREVRHLKYLESFSIRSNANSQIREINLGEDICELKHLKELVLYSYGITSLPENFKQLGGGAGYEEWAGLETLSLSATNFAKLSTITAVVNEKNFPKLTALALNGSRRTDSLLDLTLVQGGNYDGKPIGLFADITKDNREKAAFIDLLMWENLNELVMSYNFLQGEIPTDEEMEQVLIQRGRPLHYTADDFSEDKADYLDKLVGDTCRWLLTSNNKVTYTGSDGTSRIVGGQDVLRVQPKNRYFAINLNFLTGELPNWILFHPYFVEWDPEVTIFSQQEKGLNTAGEPVGFGNVDIENFDFTYYYGNADPGKNVVVPGVAYPLYYRRYVANSSSDSEE